jgi:hypothetical protein
LGSLEIRKCLRKRATPEVILTVNIPATDQLNLQSLTIDNNLQFYIISGIVQVNGNITVNSGAIFKKSKGAPALRAQCAIISPTAVFSLDDSSLDKGTVVFISTTCNVPPPPTGALELADNSGASCYDYSSAPSGTGNSIGYTYSVQSAKCPESVPPSMGWIAAVIIVPIIIIILIIIAFIKRDYLKEKFLPRGQSSHSSSVPAGNRDTAADIPAPPFTVTAIADYTAVDTTQMSLTKGVQYEVVRVAEGNYWFQSKKPNGKLCWFPASYARIESYL